MRKNYLVLAVLVSACASAQTHDIKNTQGHYYVDGFVGNAPIKFMVDTGASGVVIPRSVANRAGEWGNCNWIKFMTANGPTELCQRRVASIRFGPYEFKNIVATITADEAIDATGLLGMEALKHFQIQIGNGYMRLSR